MNTSSYLTFQRGEQPKAASEWLQPPASSAEWAGGPARNQEDTCPRDRTRGNPPATEKARKQYCRSTWSRLRHYEPVGII